MKFTIINTAIVVFVVSLVVIVSMRGYVNEADYKHGVVAGSKK